MFCHANIFHLLINLAALWSIRNKVSIIASLLVAILSTTLPTSVREPTMGLSGFLFAVFGIMWGETGRVKEAARKVMPFIVITMMFPNINGMLHLYCFWIGYIVGFLKAKARVAVHHG